MVTYDQLPSWLHVMLHVTLRSRASRRMRSAATRKTLCKPAWSDSGLHCSGLNGSPVLPFRQCALPRPPACCLLLSPLDRSAQRVAIQVITCQQHHSARNLKYAKVVCAKHVQLRPWGYAIATCIRRHDVQTIINKLQQKMVTTDARRSSRSCSRSRATVRLHLMLSTAAQ